ncbi:Potassium transporter [Basidiobolus ranarum]|uniref:Potassium transporter n=1 Tax=Basidiobolus ranarum TaxID=34480 RepID=A0ABR2WQY8_9FUNG
MCCCGGDAKWKREAINDHKFDYVDVEEYYDRSFMTKFKYCFVFVFTMKSILIYVLDVYTAVMLVVFETWTSSLNGESDTFTSQPYIRWIFVASIAFSYILLFLEIRKTRIIILSRDISFTFTSIMATRYYTLRSYEHYCFFKQIHNQKRFKDELSFFVFFSLKGWKRLFFAEAPRQVINGYILVNAIIKGVDKLRGKNMSIGAVIDAATGSTGGSDFSTKLTFITMGVPCLLFIISALRTIFAAVLYLFLVCEIQGNLKEYCCHKIDKRLTELLRYKARKRAYKDKIINGGIHPTKPVIDGFEDEIMMESVGKPATANDHYIDEKRGIPAHTISPIHSDFPSSRLDDNRRQMAHPSLQQPTLPQIDLNLDEPDSYRAQGTGQVHGNPTLRRLSLSPRRDYMEVSSQANSECSEDNYDMRYPYENKPVPFTEPYLNPSQIGHNSSRNQHIHEHPLRPTSPTHSETSSRSASTHPSHGYRPGKAASSNGRSLNGFVEDDEVIPDRYQDHYHSSANTRSRGKSSKNPSIKTSNPGAVNF